MIEDAAKCRYLKREVAVLDRHIGPDGGHDLCFRQNLAMMLDQDGEQIEGSPAERKRRQNPTLAAPKEAPLIELKAREQKAAALRQRAHATSLLQPGSLDASRSGLIVKQA
ncbi:MAG TPA: hypothetical protein VKB87_04550 [Myxococcaceae bacterium]|nr:hypothetical protein [Myxococcaceae bacterium]